MELRQLETFARVAELQSFTQAAEALYLTQPAVTRQIAALESELRTRLFERLGRKVQLTAAGERLHGYATEMLRLAQEAERAVGDVVTGTAGRLSVGASSTAATYVLPRLLRRFREAHPGVELSIHTGASAQVTERVAGGEVDVGVVTGMRERAGLVEIPLAEVETGVVVYPEHPLALTHRSVADLFSDSSAPGERSGLRACGEGVQAAELAGCPLILMEEGTNLRTYVDRLLSAAGVEERVTLELDNVEAIKKMIEAQLGISLLPLVSVEAEVTAGRLVALPLADVPNAHRRITAIYRQDKYLSAALKAFLSLLKTGL